MGWPVMTERALPLNGESGTRDWETGVYVQDDWRVRPWLTLNLGVRYDVFPPTTEVHNWLSNFDPVAAKLIVASASNPTAGTKTDYHDIAPRFGFATTLPHSLVIRGGFGISYFPANFLGSDAPVNAPFEYTFGPVYFSPLSAGLPALTAPDPNQPSGTISALALNFKSSYLEQYNLTLQKQIGANVVSVGYVGQLGRQLPYGTDLNIDLPDPSPLANPMSRAPYAQALPNVSAIKYMMNGGTSSYQGLQTAVQRQMTKDLGLSANWVWGHVIDDVESDSSPLSPYSLMPRDIRGYEKSSSDLDIRHRISLSANYNLPFGKSFAGLRGAVVKGWQVNTVTTWQTGGPFTVTNSNPQSNLGPSVTSDRPNRIASGTISHPTVNQWFDTSAFVPQAFGTIGNEGRNVLRGPHSGRIDVSLFKEFPIKEQLRVQFRAECYNLSNTPSFNMPNWGMGTVGFGTISSTVPGVGPRIFQFALKTLF
jgi:outer membrane receptor protein involved in Fe transport